MFPPTTTTFDVDAELVEVGVFVFWDDGLMGYEPIADVEWLSISGSDGEDVIKR